MLLVKASISSVSLLSEVSKELGMLAYFVRCQ